MTRPYFFGVIIFILVLSACNQQSSSGQIERVAPIRPDLPTPEVTLIPTSVVSDLVPSQIYTHTTERFRIEYPANWYPFERDAGAVFIEPGDEAGYSIFFNDVGREYSTQELDQYLITFVAENFVEEETDFSLVNHEFKEDGSIEALFAGTDPNLGEAINQVQISQVDTIIFIAFISAAQEQWELSRDRLQELVETFEPLNTEPAPDEPSPEGTSEAEPPIWTLIGPENKEFAFFYPSDWEVTETAEERVVVALPEAQFTFEARILSDSGGKEPEDSEEVALDYIEGLEDQYGSIESTEPAEFPLDTSTGTTVDFLYTVSDEDEEEIAGSIIVAFHKGAFYQIVFTAPPQLYEFALQWFNPMHKGFTFLDPEDLDMFEPE